MFMCLFLPQTEVIFRVLPINIDLTSAAAENQSDPHSRSAAAEPLKK